MQEYNSFEVVYREMIEIEDDLFVHGAPMIFQGHDAEASTSDRSLQSLQAAAAAWACWMRSEGHDVYELPRTTRTREWGLTYSVTAMGKESQLYLLTFES